MNNTQEMTKITIKIDGLNYFSANENPNGIVIKARFRLRGNIYQVNRYDQDPWPSQPHAHVLDTGQKINLTNGDLWNKGNRKQKAGRLGKKDLKRLREGFRSRGVLDLPDLG